MKKPIQLRCWAAAMASSLAASVAGAAETALEGHIAPQLRWFPTPPQHAQQERNAASISAALELSHHWGRNSVAVKPFVRVDNTDEERTHADLREAAWLHVGDDWESQLGVGKVFWGVTESRHLVDIVNQTDLVEDPDGEQKLGQPLLRLTALRSWGTLSGFVLPYFRERTFSGKDGRLRFAVPVAADDATYESGAERRHVDYALRYSHFIGPFDIGLSYFRGTDRDPALVPGTVDGQTRLIPHYAQIEQIGLDLQYTTGPWLWKLEAIHRAGELDRQLRERDYVAAVGGLEYTFFGAMDTSADIGLLTEMLWDERGDDATTPYQRDLFLGIRWALNDIQATSVLAGTVLDTTNDGQLWRVEAQRRLDSNITAELSAQVPLALDTQDVYYDQRKDEYLEIALKFWF